MQLFRSKLLNKIYRRIPFFLQCLFSFVVLLLASLIVVLLVSRQAATVARQNYLNERQYALETSAQNMTQQIQNFRAIPLTMQRQSYYTRMRLLTADKVKALHHHMLSTLQIDFSQQCSLLDICDYAFIYFQNSGAILSRNRVSFNASTFFEDAYRFSDYPVQDLLSLFSNISGSTLYLPEQTLTGNGILNGQYIPVLFHPQNESTVYCLLIEHNHIDRLFRLNEMPQNTTLILTNAQQEEIYSNRSAYTPETEYESISLSMQGLHVELQIPNIYFNEMANQLTAINRLYLLLMLIIGTALSLLFSALFQLPVRKLLHLSHSDGEFSDAKNEFVSITTSLQQATTEKQQLYSQVAANQALLQNNLLARFLTQDGYTTADESLALEYLPQLSRPSRVLCLQILTADCEPNGYLIWHIKESAEQLFGPNALVVQMRQDLFAALLPDTDETLFLIEETATAFQEELNLHGASLTAGMSESFSSLDLLHSAYLHASFSLQYFASPISVFQAPSAQSVFNISDLNLFRNAVMNCESETAHMLAERMLDCAQQISWIPSAVRLILDSVCSDLQLSVPDTSLPLIRQTDLVISMLSDQKGQFVNSLFKSILDYLSEHFADASLSNESIADHFGISKSYLYHLFRESINSTPGDKLEEIRISYANTLLIDTQMSINDIASACGYNSANTFYKAYKKHYNTSPSALRNSSK